MPLSEPSGGADFGALQIAALNQGVMELKDTAAGSIVQFSDVSLYKNNEVLIGANTGFFFILTGTLNGQKAARKTDVVAGFGAGNILQPFRAIDGDIWLIKTAAGLRQIGHSVDNGATWINEGFPPLIAGFMGGIGQTSNGRIWVGSETAVGNVSFTDNEGAVWTTVSDGMAAAGTSRGGLLVPPDGSEVTFFSDLGAPMMIARITGISGTPPTINIIDLTALVGATGTTSSPACSYRYDKDTGAPTGFMAAGLFGSFCFTTDFVNWTLLSDNDNLYFSGNGPSGSNPISLYLPDQDGYLVINPGTLKVVFYPATNPVAGQRYINCPNTLNGAMTNGAVDAEGNIVFFGVTAFNAVWRSFLTSL